MSKPAPAQKTKPAPDNLQFRDFIMPIMTNVVGIGNKIRGGIVYFAYSYDTLCNTGREGIGGGTKQRSK